MPGPVNPTYEELRQAVIALAAKYGGVEAVLRMFITPTGIGSSQWPFLVGGLNFNYLRANTDYTHSAPEVGDAFWNGRTYEIQNGPNTSTSVGEELRIPVYNDSGVNILDGQAVYVDEGNEGLPTVRLVDASLEVAQTTIGLATIDIDDGTSGVVVRIGTAHDIPLAGFSVGNTAYIDPASLGDLAPTAPEWPDYVIQIGKVIRKDAAGDNGDVLVDVRIVQREVPTPICLTTFSAVPERNAQQNIHGGLDQIVTGHDLSAGDLTLTGATSLGIGKVIVVVNAGSDFDGEITVTGTSVDRDTGVETPSDVDTLTIDALTVDAESTDANGQTKYSLTGAYMTGNWYTGDTVISSSPDTTITDIDVYTCSFEQFNDSRIVMINTFDMNVLCVSASGAAISARGYTVVVTGDKVDILPVAEFVSSSFVSGRLYRIRRGNAGLQLDGRKDGLFITMAFLGAPAKFADAVVKVWADAIK